MPILSLLAGKAVFALVGAAGLALTLATCKFHWQKLGRLQERNHVIEQTAKENERIATEQAKINQRLKDNGEKGYKALQDALAREQALQAQLAAKPKSEPTGECTDESLVPYP